MRKWIGTLAILALALAAPQEARAQGPAGVSLEARIGVGFPTGAFGDDENTESGIGLGTSAAVRILPALSLYGGYERYTFGIDTGTSEVDANVIDEGFSAGAMIFPPVPLVGLYPWLRAGALFHTVDVDVDSRLLPDLGNEFNESDRSLGFELGAGLDLPLTVNISLTPGVIFRSYEPRFDGDNADRDNISYLSGGLGLRFQF